MAHLLSFVLLLGFAPLAEAMVVISEVLADGATGDANGDGKTHSSEDEFIELYNAGSAPIAISGWRLGDSSALKNFYQFPANTVIEPGSFLVLFGGGKPTGFTIPIYIDDGTIGSRGLTNSGEDVHLINDTGDTVSVVSHNKWPTKQSLVRHPPDGDTWVPHKTASTIKALFSPGHTHIIPKPDYPLFISEVLADGATGDANQDGKRDSYEDEFIELYNAGSEPISLAGWRLGDSSALKNFFQFPADAVIEPGSYVVLFGGGKPAGFTIPVYTDDGRIGNGLTNKGEEIRLTDNIGHEIAVVSHTPWPKKQSLVRNPSDGGPFVPHKTASTVKALFSPGHTHIIPKPDYPLFISEVLADPPTGLAGDANRDGRRDTYEDEFIELYNAGSEPISLAGWRLGDSTSPKNYFQFPPDAVIAPHSYIVLFGGGSPSGFTTPVYIDDGKIGNGLTGKGEAIRLIDNNGHEIDVISHDEWPDDQSIVRTPPDGGPFVPHKTASPIELPFSPGHASTTRPLLTYPLFISEVLADPPEGSAGDANLDGQYDPHEDEFIELYNAGSRPISLAGWRLGDAGSLRDYFRFPADAVIAPDSYVVLFGGGNPSEFTTPVYTDDGTIGDGLTDSGETIHLINDYGNEAAFLYQSAWPDDQSIVRTPPDGGALVPHKTASPTEAPFSPGHAPETRPFLNYPLFISEVLADPPEGLAGDANRDGRYDPHKDEFIELYNAGSRPISLAGWRLGDAGSLRDYFRFPRDAVIAPDSYVVLFGGGFVWDKRSARPSGFTVPVYTDDGTIGDGLTDSGESIHLINDYGNEAAFLYQSTWPDDQSIVRTPPDGGALVPHKTASPTEALFSPGHAPDDEPETPEAPETPEPKTPSEPIPTYALFISEVLADPPSGAAGDANQDGQRDGYEDEFIELYNADTNPISLAGWRLGDSTSPDTHFRFPSNAIIEPGSYVVLFGGGNPSGFTVPVYTDDGRIGNGLTNKGEDIQLTDDTGAEIAIVSHGTWPKDQSIVRNPPDSEAFVPHKTVSPTDVPFSPGRATDAEPETPEVPETPKPEAPEIPEALETPEPKTPSEPIPTYALFISEVLADPPSGVAGDANQDGQRDGYEDEFIELYNADTNPISLAGWRLGDSTSPDTHFRFPSNAIIEPGSYVVLFGGGNPSGFTVPVYTDDGRIGNGLTNKGEDIQLTDDTGAEIAVVSQGTWPKDQSIVRTPADGGAFVPHKTVSPTEALFSPGRATDDELETPEVPETPKPGTPETPEPKTPSEPIPTYALFISEVLADPPSDAAGDANQDGQRDGYEDEFIELYNADSTSVDISGWRLGDSTPPDTHFRFPPDAVIAPGSYVVLFGGGNPSGFTVPVYTDDGRIGNGLTNKGEDIQLIDDAGNTVAIVSYDDWPKDQSIVRVPPDSGAFVPHKTVSPTEAPFSPGHAPKTQPETPEVPEMVFIEKIKMPPDPIPTPSPPVLQSLRPAQFEFNLVRGEHRSLRLLGQYSDGSERPIDTRATWTSSDSTIAAVRPNGTLAAIDIGTCQISVQLDSFTVHPNVLNVEVRLPLADAVRFSPPWNEAALPLAKPQAFIIRTAQPHRHAYYWSLNGRRLPVMSPQYIHTPTGRQTDTVHVAISRGTERITRAWIIYPPAAKLPAYSFQVWPNPFNTTTHLRFHLSQTASVHLAIYNVQGQRVRTLVDAPRRAGVHQMQWDGRDEHGHLAATGPYYVRFRIEHSPPRYTKLLLLR